MKFGDISDMKSKLTVTPKPPTAVDVDGEKRQGISEFRARAIYPRQMTSKITEKNDSIQTHKIFVKEDSSLFEEKMVR